MTPDELEVYARNKVKLPPGESDDFYQRVVKCLFEIMATGMYLDSEFDLVFSLAQADSTNFKGSGDRA